jgi:hypothetical protein
LVNHFAFPLFKPRINQNMNKLFASLIAGVAVAAMAGVACADPTTPSGYYVQGSGGALFGNNNSTGAAWSVAAGKDMGVMRVEGEYLGANLGHHGTETLGNVNVYAQPWTFDHVTPFVGVGVGYGQFGHNDSVAFNVTAGASVAVTSNLKLVGEYRYIAPTDAHDARAESSAAMVGVRYGF